MDHYLVYWVVSVLSISRKHQDSKKEEEKKKPHIKKPLNAFMLYMKEMRAKVVAECTLKESAAINQILGRRVGDALLREKWGAGGEGPECSRSGGRMSLSAFLWRILALQPHSESSNDLHGVRTSYSALR